MTGEGETAPPPEREPQDPASGSDSRIKPETEKKKTDGERKKGDDSTTEATGPDSKADKKPRAAHGTEGKKSSIGADDKTERAPDTPIGQKIQVTNSDGGERFAEGGADIVAVNEDNKGEVTYTVTYREAGEVKVGYVKASEGAVLENTEPVPEAVQAAREAYARRVESAADMAMHDELTAARILHVARRELEVATGEATTETTSTPELSRDEIASAKLEELGAPMETDGEGNDKLPNNLEPTEAFELKPGGDEDYASYWDRYLKIDSIPKNVDIEEVREHARRFLRNDPGRNKKLDKYIVAHRPDRLPTKYKISTKKWPPGLDRKSAKDTQEWLDLMKIHIKQMKANDQARDRRLDEYVIIENRKYKRKKIVGRRERNNVPEEALKDHEVALEAQSAERNILLDRHFKNKKQKKKKLEYEKDTIRGSLSGKLLNKLDKRYKTGIEHMEAQFNAEMKKLVDETTGTGPDNDMRLVFAYKINGVWMKYDGKGELTKSELVRRKQLLKEMKENVSLYQAKAAYEINKLESASQPNLWKRLLDVQIKELGYSQEEAQIVMIGLQFMNKPKFLAYKHSKIMLKQMRDEEGNYMYKKDSRGRYLNDENGDLIPMTDPREAVWGDMKERDYITELADKFTAYSMQFEPTDVDEIRRLAERTIAKLDKHFYDGAEGRSHNQEYMDALYVLSKLLLVVNQSTMGPSSKEMELDSAEHQDMMQRAQMGQGMYDPRLQGGSAAANERWVLMSKVVQEGAKRFPMAQKGLSLSEYEALSDRDRLDLEYYADANDEQFELAA